MVFIPPVMPLESNEQNLKIKFFARKNNFLLAKRISGVFVDNSVLRWDRRLK